MVVKRSRVNTGGQGDLKALAQMQLLSSVIASRAMLSSRMGKSFGGKRDLFEALGYPLTLTYEDYFAKYTRGDIAARIIDAPVNGTWEQKPEIVEDVETETQFEKDIQEVIKKKKLFHFLRRADLLSCIGSYAVLLLGVDDGLELSDPLVKASELLYLQPYSEGSSEIMTWDKDNTSPRYGLPETYQLKIMEPGNVTSYQTRIVHHSRVIHIAQGLLESNTYGTPKLERIYNRLLSLDLIVGGSGEMFWQGAFPGYQFNADPKLEITQDSDEIKEMIDKYVHGMKRYLTTQGMDVNKLASDIADPSKHVDVQLTMISIATGIPKRILEGSERGELASSQDESNWNDRLDSRRLDETEPTILRPVIDRLIECGVIAPPAGEEYTVIWPDLNSPSNKDKAEVGKIRTEATAKYIESGMDMLIPPKQYFEEMLDMDVEQVDRLLAGAENALEDMREEGRQAAEDAAGLVPNSNACHVPSGPAGGQFCGGGGSAVGTLAAAGGNGGKYAAAAASKVEAGGEGMIVRDKQGVPVAAASMTTISDSVQIDILGSTRPGGGSAAIYEAVKYSESKGKGGALTVASVGDVSTIGFYAKIGFDSKPGAPGRTFFLKSEDAQRFKQVYEQKTTASDIIVHAEADSIAIAIQSDLDGEIEIFSGDLPE